MRVILLFTILLTFISGFSQTSNNWQSEINKILLKSSAKGNSENVIILLNKDADANTVSEFGNSAYMYALKNGKYNTARILKLNGANTTVDSFRVSTQDHYLFPYSDTSSYKGEDIDFDLILAIYNNKIDSVRLLLKQGANANAASYYDDVHTLIYAVDNNNSKMVELLINWGANINYKSKYGDFAFINAVNNNKIEIINILLQYGVDINATDDKKISALHYSVGNNNYKLSKLLISKGANVNSKSHDSNTPLDLAIITNNIKLVKLLINANANINTKDSKKNTPLIIASQYNYIYLVDYLLKNNADYKAINNFGDNAFSVAVRNGNIEITEMIFNKDSAYYKQNTNVDYISKLADLSENKEIKKLVKQYGFITGKKPQFKKWFIGSGIITSKNDLLFSNNFGIKDTKYNTIAQIYFANRYWKNRILYPTSQKNVYTQVWERRSIISVEFDKRFNLYSKSNKQYGLFTGIKTLYTFGKYRGVDFKVDDRIIPAPKVGVYYNSHKISILFNYEYYDWGILGVSNHKLSASILFYLNPENESRYKKTIEWF